MAANVIGIIGGLLKIVDFGIKNFGNEEPDPGSEFRVAVALDGTGGTSNAGGDLPDIRVWNEYTDFVGMKVDPGTVGDGNVGSVHVEHDNQGVYTLFTANDDAICIAWVTTTWSDERGGNKYAVSGDFGRQCGSTWYYSGMYPSEDSDYQPTCFWIDRDGNQPQTGFQVRWPSFSGVELDDTDRDPNQFCNGVDFGTRTEWEPSTITYFTRRDAGKVSQRKRIAAAANNRPEWAGEELVISDSKSHSAKGVCESDTSMGPDLAHTAEKLFCDMGTKTIYNFCAPYSNSTCFDMESESLSYIGADSPLKRAAKSPYKRLRDWRGGRS